MTVQVRRFDRSTIIVKKRDDGAISGEAIATRAGVFKYRQPDGTIRSEFRSPAEVFKADSMASAKMVPITDRHPDEFVTPENAKELSVGFTGENVRADGNNLVVPVNINTVQGIAAVDDGRKELSFGYACRVDEEAGEWEGEPYSHAQHEITYNHLALVGNARAGDVATLRLDAADAVQTTVEDERKESRTMKVKLDSGLEYECAPEVSVELERVKKDAAEQRVAAEDATKKLDAVTAERDEFKTRAEKAEKIDHTEAITAGIKARLDVLDVARKVVDDETKKKLDGMSNEDIRKAVILASDPELKLDGKSEDYLAVRFDMIVEKLDAKGDDDQAQKNANTALGGTGRRDGATETHEEKRDAAIAATKARSLGKAAQ